MARRDECSSCGRDSRVCLNCRYYDASAYHECRESQAEWVRHKDEGNFCGYFRGNGSGGHQAQNPADAAKEKLAGLFNETDSAQEKKPLSLDDLFKK